MTHTNARMDKIGKSSLSDRCTRFLRPRSAFLSLTYQTLLAQAANALRPCRLRNNGSHYSYGHIDHYPSSAWEVGKKLDRRFELQGVYAAFSSRRLC